MMITYFIKNNKTAQNRKAISFVELMVCVIISVLIFKVVYDFMSNARYNYMYGVVNLQNLQDARLAINYLRRDFSSSCPKFEAPSDDIQNGYIDLQKARKQLFITKNSNEQIKGELIQIHDHGLFFHKYIYDSHGENPKVETVSYQFDKNSNSLVRTSDTKGRKVFSGFEDVHFSLYTHEMNPNVPLLWVKFRVHESENMYGSKKIGQALELTTTISSSFISSSQNNKYWRYETGHIK